MLRIHDTDPSPLVEAAFRRIERTRMQDVPILNARLHVEAVGFERWTGHWLGAVVTPWFLNLIVLPGRGDDWWRADRSGRVFLRFGRDDFAFLPGYEAECGAFLSCSLVSPMAGFDDQPVACDTARAALQMLRDGCRPDTTTPARTMTRTTEAHDPGRRALLFGRSDASRPRS